MFVTFDQSDEETWPDQKQDNDKDKDKDNDKEKDKHKENPRDFWHSTLINFFTIESLNLWQSLLPDN